MNRKDFLRATLSVCALGTAGCVFGETQPAPATRLCHLELTNLSQEPVSLAVTVVHDGTTLLEESHSLPAFQNDTAGHADVEHDWPDAAGEYEVTARTEGGADRTWQLHELYDRQTTLQADVQVGADGTLELFHSLEETCGES